MVRSTFTGNLCSVLRGLSLSVVKSLFLFWSVLSSQYKYLETEVSVVFSQVFFPTLQIVPTVMG